MKYIRYKTSNEEEYVGIVENEKIYRLKYSSIIEAISHQDSFKDTYQQNQHDLIEDVKILVPVNPTKVVCVGLNYKDHANELEMTLPSEPLLFMKPASSVISTRDTIIYPEDTQKLDFEAELGIAILSEIYRHNR